MHAHNKPWNVCLEAAPDTGRDCRILNFRLYFIIHVHSASHKFFAYANQVTIIILIDPSTTLVSCATPLNRILQSSCCGHKICIHVPQDSKRATQVL